ncbi:MAG: fused MFS/spermidine synthase [Deltaproteobacteria bacterium]|nr:fused MFS/spermidine synthase [Deltaproteobacteria bacterium]
MLEIVVFVCGAVVMILEMVGSRILAPYLGTSIVVWTSLIGVILGCLSLGYWWGGRIADRNPSPQNLSVIILLAAFCVAGVSVSKTMVLDWIQASSGSVHLGSTAATLILFAPPSVLLGMVSPYAVKLKMNDLGKSGRTVGSLYALSTVGSIGGTFLAGFFLIAYLGSTRILILMALTLVVTSLLASRRHLRLQGAMFLLMILLFLAAGAYDRYLAGMDIHDVDTRYNRVMVYAGLDGKTGRMMRIMTTNPRAMQSAMYLDDPLELALDYTRFYRMATHFVSRLHNALVLGGGGYSFPKYLLHNFPSVSVHVVELDPQVTDLARRFFHLADTPGLRIHHEDARTFLNRNQEQFDVIFVDLFTSHYAVPFHCATVEAVKKCYEALADGGAVMANMLSALEGKDGRFLQAAFSTFAAVFPQVYLFPVSDPVDPAEWQNVMLVALKSTEKPIFTSKDEELNGLLRHLWTGAVSPALPVLTDDFAPVDRYVLNWP